MEGEDFFKGDIVLSEGYSTKDNSEGEARAVRKIKGKAKLVVTCNQNQETVLSRQEDSINIHATYDEAVEQAKHNECCREYSLKKSYRVKENNFFNERGRISIYRLYCSRFSFNRWAQFYVGT